MIRALPKVRSQILRRCWKFAACTTSATQSSGCRRHDKTKAVLFPPKCSRYSGAGVFRGARDLSLTLFLFAHALELPIVLLLRHELAGFLIALGVAFLAHNLRLDLGAFADCAVAVAVPGRRVRCHFHFSLSFEGQRIGRSWVSPARIESPQPALSRPWEPPTRTPRKPPRLTRSSQS